MKQELAYSQYLHNARTHLHRLDRRVCRTPAKQMELTDEAVQELSSALEELDSANDELRRQSEDFAAAYEDLKDLFNGAPDAHLVTNQLGIIWQANHAASILLQYPIAHLKRMPLIRFLSCNSRRAFLDQLPHLEKLAPNHEFEYFVQPQFGPNFPAALTVSRVDDPVTSQASLHWQIRNVSERWNAEKRLRDLARLALLNQERDRKRISKSLYDDVGQALIALSMQLDAVATSITPEQSPTRVRLQTARALLKGTLAEIVLLAGGLYPPELDLMGLDVTLRDYCAGFARERHVEVEYSGISVKDLPDSRRILLFRILRAVLDRAAQSDHLQRLRVSLDAEGPQLRLVIEEHAAAFDGHLRDWSAFTKDEPAGRAAQDSRGITEMRDRLELLGGTLEIRAQPGSDNRITVSLPVE